MAFARRAAILGVWLFACGGEDENPASNRNRDGDTPAAEVSGGGTPLRRLTKTEYTNTVRTLLGDTFGIAEKVAADRALIGFDNGGDRFSVSVPLVEQYTAVADELAQKVDPTKLCTGADAACARSLVESFGPRAFRRPVAPDEVEDLVGLYTKARTITDHPSALRAVITRILVSPDFLYHLEIGEAPPTDGTTPFVTPYELASRISYAIWESMPDEALFAAAASGALRDRAEVERQVARLLADPKAKEAVWHMNTQWLEIERLDNLVKNEAAYPGFEAAKSDVILATRRFVDEAVWSGTGSLDAFLTAPFTFSNGRVAALYGFGVTGDAMVKVDQNPAERVGILGQPALLATLGKADKSAPLLRGVFVRDRLLCAPIPQPPPGASTIPADAPPAKTTRELFTRLTAPEQCMSCHQSINPIGFGLESFDGIGRHRTNENGHPLDLSGSITAGDRRGPFVGPVELAKKLAESRAVQECVVKNWFRFTYGRVAMPGSGDADLVTQVTDRFLAGGAVLRTLPVELAKAEPFYRLHYTVKDAP